MSILDKNIETLTKMKVLYPALNGLLVKDDKLYLDNNYISLNYFDISLLLSDDSLFGDALDGLSDKEVFDVIKAHALGMQLDKNPSDTNHMQLQAIKAKNPLLKGVSILNKTDEENIYQYLCIMDSRGTEHLYYLDSGFEILSLYHDMVGNNITPDMVIGVLNSKLPTIDSNGKINTDYNNGTIILDTFYSLLNDDGVTFGPNIKAECEKIYNYFSLLIQNESYLLPDALRLLNEFRYAIVEWEINPENSNQHKKEAIQKLNEITELIDSKREKELGQTMILDLKAMRKYQSTDRNAAFASVVITIIVVGIITLLLAILAVTFLV